MAMPDTNIARTSPIRIAKSPPRTVKVTVVTQPRPLEYSAISDLENPISL